MLEICIEVTLEVTCPGVEMGASHPQPLLVILPFPFAHEQLQAIMMLSLSGMADRFPCILQGTARASLLHKHKHQNKKYEA